MTGVWVDMKTRKRSWLLVWAVVITAFGMSPVAVAQVRSVTLGIRTHCPYGIRGCWPEIRDGLETPKAITWITTEPDIKTDTCEIKMRDDWVADPEFFQQNFRQMRIGVDVRGVEAIVDGQLSVDGTNVVLRAGNNAGALRVLPLKQKVQWDKKNLQPEQATKSEQNAYKELLARTKNRVTQVRITGPLRSVEGDERILEVRKFELMPSSK
jgi:hypothetical protein